MESPANVENEWTGCRTNLPLEKRMIEQVSCDSRPIEEFSAVLFG